VSKLIGKVQTVLGPIDPSQLGITLTHEHLLIDLGCYFQAPEEASERWFIDQPLTMSMLGTIGKRWTYNYDIQQLLDTKAAVDELMKYKLAGGNSVVDTTSIGIARDPLALARMSRQTGINVVMGASHYVPVSYPAGLEKETEQSIADRIIRDVTVGVGDTGIKAGIIGEVGNFWPTNETTRKVLRASAHAAMETGATVLIHPGFHADALMHIMNDLMEAGMDGKRVIMGHLDSFRDLGLLREVADTGATLEYDRFGWEDTSWTFDNPDLATPSDVQRMERFEKLIEWGCGDRLVVAHDVCFKTDWAAYGGKGFAHILENLVPRMRKRGFTEKQINAILVDNPRRMLTFR
jgi:phosphotriesterase-related protein